MASTHQVFRAPGRLLLPLMLLALLATSAPAQAADDGPYSRAELARMLAPIALYPDVVLAQVLMASTYPIEVVEADRWVKRNPELEGKELDAALLRQDWATSVKELCHLPSILALMSEQLAETTELGNAFLAQEEEVMEVVQELRSRAYKRGRLSTTNRHKVVITESVIVIQPIDPRVIYVPYYDPCYVFDPWGYPPCSAYAWRPSGVSIRVGIGYWPGFYFGYAFSSWCSFDWHRRIIYIDVHQRPRYVRHDRWRSEPGRWVHVPEHRRGVAYRDLPTAKKYRHDRAHSEQERRELRKTRKDHNRKLELLERNRQLHERSGKGVSTPEKIKTERQQREEKRYNEKRQEKLEKRERNRQEIERRPSHPERERREFEEERQERRSEKADERGSRRYEDDAWQPQGDEGRNGWKGYER